MSTDLLGGVNHVAVVTDDLDRLVDFYVRVFDADVDFVMEEEDGLRHAMIDLGRGAALHPFQIPDNPHGRGLSEMFARGHMDHLALNAPNLEMFEALRARLVEAGASDGTVIDWGTVRTISFEDPDGAYGEVGVWCGHGEPLRFSERIVEEYVALA
jgi:catechol 2,3-dioxygenase-like lactoylglutathione lyase family enzyme